MWCSALSKFYTFEFLLSTARNDSQTVCPQPQCRSRALGWILAWMRYAHPLRSTAGSGCELYCWMRCATGPRIRATRACGRGKVGRSRVRRARASGRSRQQASGRASTAGGGKKSGAPRLACGWHVASAAHLAVQCLAFAQQAAILGGAALRLSPLLNALQ